MKDHTVQLILAFIAGMITYRMLFAQEGMGLDVEKATVGVAKDLSHGNVGKSIQDSAVGQGVSAVRGLF